MFKPNKKYTPKDKFLWEYLFLYFNCLNHKIEGEIEYEKN